MERAVYRVLETRRKVRLRWEMGYIIISYSSRHITSFINRGTRYTPGCLRGGELLLSVTALLLGVPAELLGRVSGDGTDDSVYKTSGANIHTIRSAQTNSTWQKNETRLGDSPFFPTTRSTVPSAYCLASAALISASPLSCLSFPSLVKTLGSVDPPTAWNCGRGRKQGWKRSVSMGIEVVVMMLTLDSHRPR